MKKHVRELKSEHRTQISFVEICCAYFCAETNPIEPRYVELLSGDPDYGKKAGLLIKHMYRTREAADGLHCEYVGPSPKRWGSKLGTHPLAYSSILPGISGAQCMAMI